jgi:hypothetical protein
MKTLDYWIWLKFEKMGLFLVKKVKIEKSAFMSLTPFLLTHGYQRGLVQKF